jgi:chemotaxis protein MotB
MARSDPAPAPVIVKKVINVVHGGHHGGAWKVAYADFVTAMMAFFLLMWLLGATTEKQRKALADYFAPTLIKTKSESAGSTGVFGGDSLVSVDNYPHRAGQTGSRSITIPRDAVGGPKEASARANDRSQFKITAKKLMDNVSQRPELKRLASNVRLTMTSEGMRIDVVDDANFSMFASGSSQLTAEGTRLFAGVADAIGDVPNRLIVRGHTDSGQFSSGAGTNNWRLSAERAEVARSLMEFRGVGAARFQRIEGVADREPYVETDANDPRNRRISITLGWSG